MLGGLASLAEFGTRLVEINEYEVAHRIRNPLCVRQDPVAGAYAAPSVRCHDALAGFAVLDRGMIPGGEPLNRVDQEVSLLVQHGRSSYQMKCRVRSAHTD